KSAGARIPQADRCLNLPDVVDCVLLVMSAQYLRSVGRSGCGSDPLGVRLAECSDRPENDLVTTCRNCSLSEGAHQHHQQFQPTVEQRLRLAHRRNMLTDDNESLCRHIPRIALEAVPTIGCRPHPRSKSL